MFEDIGTLLTNPDQFFEGRTDDPSLLEPALLVASMAVIAVVSSVVTILVFVEAVPAEVRLFLLIGAIVGALFAVVTPFIIWLLYAMAFQILTYFFGGEGEFRDTFALTGWGFAPRVIGALISLVITVYVTQTVQPPADLTAFQSFSNQVATHPLNVASSGLAIVFAVWSAYIWIPAVQRARDVTRRQATVAVAIPVALGILLTVAGVYLSAVAQGAI